MVVVIVYGIVSLLVAIGFAWLMYLGGERVTTLTVLSCWGLSIAILPVLMLVVIFLCIDLIQARIRS